MNSIYKAIEEDNEFEVAKAWLNENGTFKNWKIEKRNSKSLNSTIIEMTNKITFQKKGSIEIKTDEGDDLKQITINIYRAEL
ncbi:hypothetical protein [Flavobacterium foetidum]|uniref:hypothetical protein n=1 Tax=Flavobacterium foetidum TaxID=2026681 RepID=UPI0010758BC9|nr:hypothetical protein [Flavobacterium foetidum]KAF2516453.1 hypothetical protein E0W73_05010 [Flavobacterium foetidum]